MKSPYLAVVSPDLSFDARSLAPGGFRPSVMRLSKKKKSFKKVLYCWCRRQADFPLSLELVRVKATEKVVLYFWTHVVVLVLRSLVFDEVDYCTESA